MKKLLSLFLVVLIISLFFFVPAFAKNPVPVGSCAPGFQLMSYMDSCGVNMSMHIGLDKDLNGDGLICVQVISPDLHLHIDNTYPLP